MRTAAYDVLIIIIIIVGNLKTLFVFGFFFVRSSARVKFITIILLSNDIVWPVKKKKTCRPGRMKCQMTSRLLLSHRFRRLSPESSDSRRVIGSKN